MIRVGSFLCEKECDTKPNVERKVCEHQASDRRYVVTHTGSDR